MNKELLKKMEELGLNDVSISDGSDNKWYWEGAKIRGNNCRLFVHIQMFTSEAVDFVDEPTWNCCVSAVPVKIPKKQQSELRSCMGIAPDQEITSWGLFEYGRCAPLVEMDQDDPDFTAWLAKELPLIENLFGFYMDKPVNRMGTTGWERLGMK